MNGFSKTTYVNFYGAPGSGKSTGAAYVFSRLKLCGVDCEYVPEFAKDMVWQDRRSVFEIPELQTYVFANQFYRLRILRGRVRYVVTDSPILLSAAYAISSSLLGSEYATVVRRLNAGAFPDRINVLVKRTAPYDRNGRNEDEVTSDAIADRIREVLSECGEEYVEIAGNEDGYRSVASLMAARAGVTL